MKGRQQRVERDWHWGKWCSLESLLPRHLNSPGSNPRSMVASAGGADRELAVSQFPRYCEAIIFILLCSCWTSFQRKRFTNLFELSPRVLVCLDLNSSSKSAPRLPLSELLELQELRWRSWSFKRAANLCKVTCNFISRFQLQCYTASV
jgi:hypothetical protein